MTSEDISLWPETLVTQLEFSKSHLPLFASIGPAKSFIGIFELFSRTPLPARCNYVMARIPQEGYPDLDSKFAKPGESLALSGYSILAVAKALSEIPQNYRTGSQVKKLIHECMREVLKAPVLLHDITTAAKSLARLNLSKKSNEVPQREIFRPFTSLKWLEEAGGAEDRPQDWRSSHWWTGE